LEREDWKSKAKDEKQWIEESRRESRGDEPHGEALEGMRDHIALNRRDVQVGVLALGEVITGLYLRNVKKLRITVKRRLESIRKRREFTWESREGIEL
jgi:hypothetical protein